MRPSSRSASGTLQEAIEDLLVKERLDLPPRLRELDAQIEAIELALRGLIRDVLVDEGTTLPQHVLQKINERIQVASRKNPALDENFYRTLEGKLEFADLRELEGTVTSRILKPLFPRVVSEQASAPQALRSTRRASQRHSP